MTSVVLENGLIKESGGTQAILGLQLWTVIVLIIVVLILYPSIVKLLNGSQSAQEEKAAADKKAADDKAAADKKQSFSSYGTTDARGAVWGEVSGSNGPQGFLSRAEPPVLVGTGRGGTRLGDDDRKAERALISTEYNPQQPDYDGAGNVNGKKSSAQGLSDRDLAGLAAPLLAM